MTAGRLQVRRLVFVLSISVVSGCGPSPEPVTPRDVTAPKPMVFSSHERPRLVFTEVNEAAGIGWQHHNGAVGDKLLPETMGGGVAVLDVDNDRDPDILFVGGRPWQENGRMNPSTSLALYLNDGGGSFTDTTQEWGLHGDIYGMGAAVGDVDNDGDVDVYVTAVGRNRFFRNDGGFFTDVTRESGVGGDPSAWSTGAGFFDADNDGDLDLWVVQYVRWSRDVDFKVGFTLNGRDRAYGPPMSFEGAHSTFFRNDGGLRFVDVSREAGVRIENPHTGKPMAKGLGLTFLDVDDDGLLDVIVANDTVQNFLYRNLGECFFEEVGAEAGLAFDANGRATGAMGIDAGDVRNDGSLAVVIGNFANEMTSLYAQQGQAWSFADEAIIEGIGSPSRRALSFGVLFFDADLDGRLDLLQVNGHLEEAISEVQASQSYRQPAQLFWNAGDEGPTTFAPAPVSELGDLARPVVGRGVASADFDGDGDLDLVVVDNGDGPMLLRNDQAVGHKWLQVRLEGGDSNTGAIGATIELEVGGVVQRRRVVPTRGYLSQSWRVATFGLGGASVVDRLTVRWPGGSVQNVVVEGVNRQLVIRQVVR